VALPRLGSTGLKHEPIRSLRPHRKNATAPDEPITRLLAAEIPRFIHEIRPANARPGYPT
jgi:hypothetical protein